MNDWCPENDRAYQAEMAIKHRDSLEEQNSRLSVELDDVKAERDRQYAANCDLLMRIAALEAERDAALEASDSLISALSLIREKDLRVGGRTSDGVYHVDGELAPLRRHPRHKGAKAMTAVEVCPDCDIAGCKHIRERDRAAKEMGRILDEQAKVKVLRPGKRGDTLPEAIKGSAAFGECGITAPGCSVVAETFADIRHAGEGAARKAESVPNLANPSDYAAATRAMKKPKP